MARRAPLCDRAALLAGCVGRAVCGFGASTVTGGNDWPDWARAGPTCMLSPNTVAQKTPFDAVRHTDSLTQSRFILVDP